MPFVETSTGARLHYVERNPANPHPIPVIAVHGMLGTAETHLGHVMNWLEAQGYRVIGPTMRGYGQSEPKPRDFPLRFYDRDAADVLAMMDALNIDRAHIIGYSDGGEIALMCAGLQPERFASSASWGAVGYFGPDMRPVAQRMIPGSAWMTDEDVEQHQLGDKDNFAQQWVRATVHMIDSGGDVSVSLASDITCPVLVMLGTQDTLNPASYAQVFLEKVKNGKLAMFDCGHPVHDEQTEAFYAALKAHLENAPS
ncbi:MAG: hypothetical protein CL607_24560 [Anaerolineaceae bacterium]|nr:hypothetical protein [Anaerolineaceae bacterium]